MKAHRLSPLLLFAFLFALVGCPRPQYLVADVTTQTTILSDALVAASCGPRGAARRTDKSGRATLPLYGRIEADLCRVTVAKPGFETVERPLELCSNEADCPPTRYILRPLNGGDR